MNILREFGYKFEPRGYVKVKGKGELMTYFLIGSRDAANAMAAEKMANDEVTTLPKSAVEDEGVEV